MQYRKFGNTGIKISALGFGAMRLPMGKKKGKDYVKEDESIEMIHYAFNNGGVKIRLSKHKSIIAFSNWYNGRKPEDLEGALTAWDILIDNADNIPIVWGGDFNSVSHLDNGIGKYRYSLPHVLRSTDRNCSQPRQSNGVPGR